MSDARDIKEFMDMEPLKKQDTFRFKCDGCGKCCKNREDILLTPYDIFRICKFLKITLDEFLETYCQIYIGSSSRLPVVRLRTSAVCVFSMHGKCLIHEVKPAVCALYPLGRFTKYGSDSYEIRYFLQDVSCGTKDQENVVEDWLKNLGPDHEECAHIWHSMISEFIPLIEDIPKTDTSRTEKLAVVIFELAYGKYDYNKDFLPQFKERLEIIKAFCKAYGNMNVSPKE